MHTALSKRATKSPFLLGNTMELLEAVKQSKTKYRTGRTIINWSKVAELMGNDKTIESYRSKYKRIIGQSKDNSKLIKKVNNNIKKGVISSKDIIVKEITSAKTLDELCYLTKLSELEVYGTIEQLRTEGYDIIQSRVGDKVCYQSNKKAHITYHEFQHFHDVKTVIRIGLISDTHIASIYFQKLFLQLAYKDFKKNGIKDVYHCGDITDGMYGNRPGSVYELYAIGFDQQADAVEREYPQEEDITTHFITGNHDATHMANGGANIGLAIAKRRKDMKYLGHEYAKIWLTDKVDLDLVHPRDGSAYAYSYKTQKRIDAMTGGSKPKIMAIGHYHKNFTMFYRNIWTLGMASFQSQSPFMRGMGLVSDVGYVILEIVVNHNGDIIELTPRYKSLYEMVKEY